MAQWLHIRRFPLTCHPVLRLKVHPRLRIGTERRSEPDGQVGGDAHMTVHRRGTDPFTALL